MSWLQSRMGGAPMNPVECAERVRKLAQRGLDFSLCVDLAEISRLGVLQEVEQLTDPQLRMMGDLAKNPRAKPRAEATIQRDLRRCQHPQAEPVILSTGELVACVCIGCYEQLPADYIERQVEAAHIKACCPHPDLCVVCG